VQSIRNGTIGFSTVSTANLNQVIPAMDMYSLPFLFKNEAHFWWFLAQPEAAALAKPLEDKGIKIIAYIDSGARNFFAQKAIRSPDDMKGVKVRVMASPVMISTMKALGATGVPVAWAELYTALQTGVVDGAENNHPSVVAKKFYEVSKYYTLDEHMRIPDAMIMSMKLWNQLNDDQKKAVLEARTASPSLYAWRVARVGGEGSPGAQGQVHRDSHSGQNAVREGCFRNGERRSEAARCREDDRLHSRLAKELLKAHRVHCIRAAAIRRHYVKGGKP
jgi:tripartite ATP-independent periplasmic transporter solute receptor, DctP family